MSKILEIDGTNFKTKMINLITPFDSKDESGFRQP